MVERKFLGQYADVLYFARLVRYSFLAQKPILIQTHGSTVLNLFLFLFWTFIVYSMWRLWHVNWIQIDWLFKFTGELTCAANKNDVCEVNRVNGIKLVENKHLLQA